MGPDQDRTVLSGATTTDARRRHLHYSYRTYANDRADVIGMIAAVTIWMDDVWRVSTAERGAVSRMYPDAFLDQNSPPVDSGVTCRRNIVTLFLFGYCRAEHGSDRDGKPMHFIVKCGVTFGDMNAVVHRVWAKGKLQGYRQNVHP